MKTLLRLCSACCLLFFCCLREEMFETFREAIKINFVVKWKSFRLKKNSFCSSFPYSKELSFTKNFASSQFSVSLPSHSALQQSLCSQKICTSSVTAFHCSIPFTSFIRIHEGDWENNRSVNVHHNRAIFSPGINILCRWRSALWWKRTIYAKIFSKLPSTRNSMDRKQSSKWKLSRQSYSGLCLNLF